MSINGSDRIPYGTRDYNDISVKGVGELHVVTGGKEPHALRVPVSQSDSPVTEVAIIGIACGTDGDSGHG